MAQQNLVFANEQLFARKGEAAPASATVTTLGHGCFSQKPHNGSEQPDPPKGKRGKHKSSPLSSLIQRGTCMPEEPGDRIEALASEHPVFATWQQLRNRLETAAHPAEDEEPWKKLTFRLRGEQYVRLKNLAGLWGTTYQGILEKAVTYYIEEATTSEDFKWKV